MIIDTRIALLLPILLVVDNARDARATDTSILDTDSQVRVTTSIPDGDDRDSWVLWFRAGSPKRKTYEGLLVSHGDSTLSILPTAGRTPIVVRLSEIEKLEVPISPTARESLERKYMLLGAGLPLAAGVIGAFILDRASPETDVGSGLLTGMILLMPFGAWLGSSQAGQREWMEVSLRDGDISSVSGLPLRVGVTLSF